MKLGIIAGYSGRKFSISMDAIKHAENFLTRYAHLSKRLVTENSTVQNGTHIGNVGSTGRSTGPHLHYEIFQNGRVLNPLKVLPVKTP